jgi:hypothetical protein
MKNLWVAFLLVCLTTVQAQDAFHCATDVAMRKFYNEHPGAEAKKRAELKSRSTQPQLKTSSITATYIVPIVFHIMHLGGPENVSDSQIKDAVRILNRDFAKQNPDTIEIISAFKNVADSAKVQFVLATKDPSGNCTNGIIHHYSTDTDWNENSPTLFSFTWDPTKYMNVYIVRSITLGNGFPAAGYTYYPGTWVSGSLYDAIVVLNNYMGSIGTGSSFLSRVLTHEVGHWLGLAHVFGYFQTAGIDCSDDDFIADTPPTIGYSTCPDANLPALYQTCTPGIDENYQNYMDYSYCVRMFTKDQCQAMQAVLQDNTSGRDNLSTTGNLLATGVINPIACAPIADFKNNRTKICAGNTVIFTDDSGNGLPTSYNWTFTGGIPASSTSSAPAVTYPNPGVYSVTYFSSNSIGSSVPVSKTNLITVTSNTAVYSNNWTEGFENANTFAIDWLLKSTSGSGLWERSGTAAYNGVFSAKIPRLFNTRKNRSTMTGTSVNLSGLANPFLNFRVAAAENVPNHTNFLKVFASTDCGNSWTEIYSKVSAVLKTSNTTAQDFIPSANEWRAESIDLSALQPKTFVLFKFEYVRDTVASPNNIYIDNINISSGATSINDADTQAIQNLVVYPVPAKDEVHLRFSLSSKQSIRFSLMDVLGRQTDIIAETSFTAGEQNFKIDLKDRTNGIYFLRMEINGTEVTRKILVGD